MIGLLAATALAARLGATSAEPYDYYASGRPRRAVAYFQDASDVRLLRLPDDDGGTARVLDHEACDATQCALEWAHLIDLDDLVINMDIGRGYAVADRIRGDRFVRIWEGEVSFTPDLDGDGVPEIVSTHYIGPMGPCSAVIAIHIGRWNGTRYRADKRRYVALASVGRDDEIKLDASKHYVVHVYGHGRALFDDEPVTPGKVFTTEDDCHTFAVKGSKSAWAFLEERP
jgi:hypothetical protein